MSKTPPKGGVFANGNMRLTGNKTYLLGMVQKEAELKNIPACACKIIIRYKYPQLVWHNTAPRSVYTASRLASIADGTIKILQKKC